MKDDIRTLKEELNAKTEELETFIYIVSHDVKAPLRAINNLVDWIEEDLNGAGEDVKENFTLLKNRVKRIESMMNALTELSRVRRMELDIAETNVTNLIQDILDIIPEKKNIQIEIGQMPVFRTMHRKLYKVLFALIENAIFFHDKPNGKVIAYCQDQGDMYTFGIKDNGPGIPEELISKVFTVFYTVNPKDIVETTGVGLTLAKKIVEFVGGEIKLYSRQNEGCEVIFTWPKTISLNI